MSISLPADFVGFGLLNRIYEWPHAHLVVGIRLHQVDDVKSVNFVFAGVLYAEVVPLRVACRSVIALQVQIVFVVGNLDRSAQVAAFEAALKDQCVIRDRCLFEFVVRLQVFVVSVEPRAFFIRCGVGFLADGSDVGAVCMRLLQTIRQVVRVKVIFLLVRLVDGALPGLADGRKFNQFAFVDVKVVDGAIVMRR